MKAPENCQPLFRVKYIHQIVSEKIYCIFALNHKRDTKRPQISIDCVLKMNLAFGMHFCYITRSSLATNKFK